MNYYNEFDHKAAAWLRELIKAKLIPDGYVDERSIADVKPAELAGFTQCHFFAGIGGWSLALQLAGWPEDREVWTGSCPCQPFSCAGRQRGESDERHVWPEFKRLISECRPAIIFGEQVASKLGREWLAGVRTDLEKLAYEVGAADLCAAGVRAPHIRQRLYWMAHARCQRDERWGVHNHIPSKAGIAEGETQEWKRGGDAAGDCGAVGGLADASNSGWAQHGQESREWGPSGENHTAERGGTGGMGDANCSTEERQRPVCVSLESKQEAGRPGYANAWSRYEVIGCADGKARRIEPESFPLVAGLPKGMVHSCNYGLPINPQATAEARVIRLRGYGNSIVPQLAAIFIKSAYEAMR
jgi:DNA (cytosine-5)-methyltransferase 1